MSFNDISVYRDADNKQMHVIKPGSYGYLYTGVEQKLEDLDSSFEDEKINERDQLVKDPQRLEDLYKGEVKLDKYRLQFIDDGNVSFISEPDYFYTKKKSYTFYPEELLDNESQKDEEEPVTMILEVIKFNTFIYTPYILINKTDVPIRFGEKGSKDEKTKMIEPHTNEFFNPLSSKKTKFSIRTDDYEWAKAFDITTMGMSGEASIKRDKKFDMENEIIQKYNSNILNFGVLISSLSSPYGKTTAVKFVPRYVIVNHCKSPIILAQESDKTTRQFFLKQKEELIYNFENRKDSHNFIKIREPTPRDVDENSCLDYHEIEETDWSSRFSIDDFEDFQISFKSTYEDRKEETKKVQFEDRSEGEGNENELKWYEPSEINEFRRFVRVIITTQDEATLFIMLCDPNLPEYRIHNYSARTVKVYQDNIGPKAVMRSCKKAVISKPTDIQQKTKIETYPIPFVWDDQTKDDKKIIIEIAGERKQYDLDEIEDKKDLIIKNKKYYIKLISTGYFRELEIRDRATKVDNAINSKTLLKNLMVVSQRNKTGLKADLDLRGVGISFVDKEPKEVLYISIFKILAKVNKETIDKGRGEFETSEELDLMIFHMQIDNMVTKQNTILFSPEEVLDQNKILTDEEYTPFVQIKLSNSKSETSNVSRRKIDALQVMIQKMKVEVETGALNVIIGTIMEITGVFGDEKTEYLSAQTLQKKKELQNADAETLTRKTADNKSEGITTEKDENKEFKKEDVCVEL